MKIKPIPIHVSPDDPFKEDLLSRKESGEVLTDFVSSLEEPFVLAVDSPWGTGKTTFLRMWMQQLEKASISCLYFNAWESDFTDSPLVSLLGELGAYSKSIGHPTKTNDVLEKTKKAGAALLKAALPTAIKMATSGILDLSKDTEDALSKLAEDTARKQIEKYEADKATLGHFREELTKLVKSISSKSTDAAGKPLVFIIDELDRCRPPYAVMLLEKVKHLFSVPGLVFILSIDKRQIRESIKSLYGHQMDADGYLRRFIDLEYLLPKPDVKKFVDAQFGRFGLDSLLSLKAGDTCHEYGHLREALPELFKLFDFSLRTQEQVFTQLSVVIRATPASFYLYGFHLALLLCLRAGNRNLYEEYVQGVASPEKVMTFLRSLTHGESFMTTKASSVFEAYLIMGIPDYNKRTQAREANAQAASSEEKKNPKTMRANEVERHFGWILRQNFDNMTAYLHRKIELAQRFVQPNSE